MKMILLDKNTSPVWLTKPEMMQFSRATLATIVRIVNDTSEAQT
jgi:hypothetical protein